MGKEKMELMVDGGSAKADPSMAQKLGPMKINIGEVLKKINDKTANFKGVRVPVKLIIDTDTKDVEITVGTPPVSELIKKELGIEKGSGQPNKIKAGNISIEQVIKVAKMKMDSMFVNSLKAAVKNVIGSCNSLGVLVESRPAVDAVKDVNDKKYDNEINNEIIEASKEKLLKLKEYFDVVKEKQRIVEAAKAAAEAAPAEGEVKEEEKGKEEKGKKEFGKKEEKKTAGKEEKKAEGKKEEPKKEAVKKEEKKPVKEDKGKKK